MGNSGQDQKNKNEALWFEYQIFFIFGLTALNEVNTGKYV